MVGLESGPILSSTGIMPTTSRAGPACASPARHGHRIGVRGPPPTSNARVTLTIDVRPAHRFDEAALARYLATHLPGFSGPLEVRQFTGGQSNPTFLLRAASGACVLRKQPPGPLLASAHAVDREYAWCALSKAASPWPVRCCSATTAP